MSHASRPALALARRIVDRELAGRRTPIDVAQGVDGAFRRLYDVMTPLIGAIGFRAVMARAVHLAGTGCAWLALEGGEGPVVSTARLASEIERNGPEPAAACAASILGNTISLLCSFIGDDLTFRLLGRVWPELGAP